MLPPGRAKRLAELAIVAVALIFAHFMPARLGYWDVVFWLGLAVVVVLGWLRIRGPSR